MRILLAALLLGPLLPVTVAHAGDAKRPNLIFIVTDDQARWGVGAYGNKEVRTPNLDLLARQGALFQHAFVATPVCSPSRASLMTGKYGTQVNITDFINPKEGKAGVGLPEHALPWPAVLQRHGYVTGLIGKWHLGDLAQFHPTRRGFHHFFGFVGGGNTPLNPTLEENGQVKKFQGSLPDILTDNAIDFVKKNRDKPFALCLHFRAPHAPYAPVPEEDSKWFKDLDPTIPKFKGLNEAQVKKLTREYYASIHSVDRNLGRLLAVLQQFGLEEDTLVVFTSDHGYMIGHHGLWHKGNGVWLVENLKGVRRPNMFDHSLRVPLLVRWPRVVRPGTQIEEMVSNIDTFPTVLGLLKVTPPGDYKHEGADFSPLLHGKKIAWRDAVFSQYDLHNGGAARMRSIRTKTHHLIRHYEAKGLDELYDLTKDPEELVNVHDEAGYRAVRDQLQARLDEWMRGIGDPLVAKNK